MQGRIIDRGIRKSIPQRIMGLLLVGFGVKDSIMTIGDRQYNFIHTMNVLIAR